MVIIPFVRFTLLSNLSAAEYTDRLRALLQSSSYGEGEFWYVGTFKEARFTLRSRRRSRFERRLAPTCWVKLSSCGRQGVVCRVVAAEPGVLLYLVISASLAAVKLWSGHLRFAVAVAALGVFGYVVTLDDFNRGLSFVQGLLLTAAEATPQVKHESDAANKGENTTR